MKIDALLTLYGRTEGQQAARPGLAGAGAAAPELLAGQLVKARVAALVADGRYELQIGRHTILAQSRLPLEIGRQLWLEVQVAGSSLLLSRPHGQEAVQKLLQHLATDGQASAKTISSLVQLPTATGKELPPEEAARLLPLLRGVASLTVGKGPVLPRLLESIFLLRPFSGGRGAAPPTLAELVADFLRGVRPGGRGGSDLLRAVEGGGVDRLLALLDACNILNTRPSGPGQSPFCLLPCFFGAEGGWGFWMCRVEEEGGEGGKGGQARQTLRFFLQMSRLGPLSLLVQIQERQLQGTIACGNHGVAGFLAARLPEAEAALAGHGYGPVRISCRTAEMSLLQEFKQQLEEHAGLPAMGLLDVKI